MTGAERRRPIGAIVAAVVGGLILLWPAMDILMAYVDRADQIVAAIFTAAACLAFVSAGFACRRPFVAGVLAALAVLSVPGYFAYVGFVLPGASTTGFEPIIVSIAFYIVLGFFCVLAALLNFNRWGRERQRDPVTVDTAGEEGSE